MITANTKQNWHSLSLEETLKALDSNIDGLSEEEAKKRLKRFGKNEIPEKNGEKILTLLLAQFKNPLIYILVIAGAIAFLLKDFLDAYIILGAVILNTIIGFSQELKVSNILRELSKTLSYQAVALRDKKTDIIDSKEITIGDVLIIKQGEKIAADARIIKSFNFKTNEAALTGESQPVDKHEKVLSPDTSVADRVNMIYLGTFAEQGAVKAIVTNIGLGTEFGKIASIVKKREKKDETPLKIKFKKLSGFLGLIFITVSALLFALGIFTGIDPLSMFITSVAVAVAAIPESLPIALTVTLAIGAKKILKKKGLVRKMVAAETLGSTTLIAVDKTATLTEGKMSVTKIVTADGKEISGEDAMNKIQEKHSQLSEYQTLKLLSLVSDAFIENPSDPPEDWILHGNPLNKAAILTVTKAGFSRASLEEKFPKVNEMPFDASYKYSAVLSQLNKDENIITVLGAPESVWSLSNTYYSKEGLIQISKEKKEWLKKTLNNLAEQGFRVLAIGFKTIPENVKDLNHSSLKNLTFLSFVAFSDPIRKEVPQALMSSREAGVRVVMITGDHALTAKYVAKELNFFRNNDESRIIEGKDLEKNPNLLKNVEDYDVFARITPEYKVKILEAFKEKGESVAMIGDGINDAPALLKADIGVAVGSGTDVAKEASDIVLLNNSFSTIVEAIRQGRIILDNIRKSVVFSISDAFSEVILIAGSILLGLPLALLAVQILWVNIIEGGLPAISLAFENEEGNVMKRGPVKKGEIFTKDMKYIIGLFIVITDLALLYLFYYMFKTTGDIDYARTMVFVALGITSLFYIFSVKSLNKPVWKINLFSNKILNFSVILGLGLYFLSIYFEPFANILQTVPLVFSDWMIIIGISILSVAVIELGKWLFIWRRKSA